MDIIICENVNVTISRPWTRVTLIFLFIIVAFVNFQQLLFFHNSCITSLVCLLYLFHKAECYTAANLPVWASRHRETPEPVFQSAGARRRRVLTENHGVRR